MTIKMHKIWFDGDKLVTQEIPEEKLYNREPVAWVVYGKGEKHDVDFYQNEIDAVPVGTLLYTSRGAEQREWVGLTREDMAELRRAGLHSISDKAFEAIANFLKEKNNR